MLANPGSDLVSLGASSPTAAAVSVAGHCQVSRTVEKVVARLTPARLPVVVGHIAGLSAQSKLLARSGALAVTVAAANRRRRVSVLTFSDWVGLRVNASVVYIWLIVSLPCRTVIGLKCKDGA